MSDEEDDKVAEIKPAGLTLIENKSPQPVAHEEEPPVDDNEVYGFDRTRKPKMMLSFHMANDSRCHIPYPQILMMDETGGCFLTIYTTSGAITVEGENLENIAYRIKRGDLSYIREGAATAPDGARVDRIVIDDLLRVKRT